MADAKPALPRDGTMQVTAKEGEKLLDSIGGAPDEDAATRGQARKLDEIKNEVAAESPAKKAKLAKDSTMVATAKEGKDLLGKEKLGDTRQETTRKASNKPAPKRGLTMAKTLEEAKYVLDGKDVDITEGRRTRSQSRPQAPTPAKTPAKRAGTMQKTAKEGKESVKRAAPAKGKGKGKGKKPADDGDKEEEEEKKEAEEEKKSEDEEKEDGKDESEDDKKE